MGQVKHMKMTRSRSGRFVRRSSRRPVATAPRRRVRRARRVRANPPHSAAMRRKISLAVKRSFRARKSGRTTSTRSVVRRGRHHSPAMRRKISLAVRRSMRGGGGSVAGRGKRVFSVYRNPPKFGGGLVKGILGMVSKDTLMIAGGAVAASFGTGMILNKFGDKLPGLNGPNPATNEKVRAVYSIAIPVVAGYLIRRKQPRIAEGLVIGGLIMGLNSLIRSFVPSVTTIVQGPMGNFYETSGSRGMGLAGEVPLGLGEYVTGSNPGGMSGDLSSKAFPDSAWGTTA